MGARMAVNSNLKRFHLVSNIYLSIYSSIYNVCTWSYWGCWPARRRTGTVCSASPGWFDGTYAECLLPEKKEKTSLQPLSLFISLMEAGVSHWDSSGKKMAFKQSRFKNLYTMRFKSSNRRTSTCLMSLEASAAALATILSSIKGNTLLRSATEQSKPDKPVLGAFGWFCVSKQVQETVRDHAWGVIWPWWKHLMMREEEWGKRSVLGMHLHLKAEYDGL